jgi:hypothetical protein
MSHVVYPLSVTMDKGRRETDHEIGKNLADLLIHGQNIQLTSKHFRTFSYLSF